MMNSNVSTECWYFDGQVPEARAARLLRDGNWVTLKAGDLTHIYRKRDLSVSPRIGDAGRFVKLKGGGQCYCSDHGFLDQLPQEFVSEGPVAWLENHISAAITSIVVVAAVLLLGYIYVLPAVARSVLDRVPVEAEATLGRNIMTWFDDKKWLQPSSIDPERRDVLKDSFKQFIEGLAMSPRMKLEFRDSKMLGPNAFALPGGTIVLTDELVKLAQSDEEILAVLAHEAGHVEKRHAMRHILQNSFVALAAATVTSDVHSAGAAFTGLPAILLQKKYSRELETEADDFAIALMKKHDISPDAFAGILEKLGKETGSAQRYSYLSTHPLITERIERAREASNPR